MVLPSSRVLTGPNSSNRVDLNCPMHVLGPRRLPASSCRSRPSIKVRSARDSSSSIPSRPTSPASQNSSSSISPARLLHTLEFTAIAIAAVGQAALLVSTAVTQWRQTQQIAELQDHLSSVEGSLLLDPHSSAQPAAAHAARSVDSTNQQQSQQHLQLHHAQAAAVTPAHSSVLHLVTGSALVVGLLCGAGLRQLQPRHPPLQGSGSGLKPSAEAAVRLAALEVATQQTAAQVTSTARQLDKLQARVRLATSDLKQPIRAAQGAAAQQAAALLRLSEQQGLMQRQLDGSQEVIAALQGLAAKQFKVSAEALQQLKQGQSQLSSSTSKAVQELQRQQQGLQQQIQAQQQQLQLLKQQAAALRRQQYAQDLQQLAAAGVGVDNSSWSSSASGSSSGSASATPPDPWQPSHAVAAAAPAASEHVTTGNSSSSSSATPAGSDGSPLSGRLAAADSAPSSSSSTHVPPSNGHSPRNGVPGAGLNGASSPATSAA